MSIETLPYSFDRRHLKSKQENIEKLVKNPEIKLTEKIKQISGALNEVEKALKTLDSTQEGQEKTALLSYATYLNKIKQEVEDWKTVDQEQLLWGGSSKIVSWVLAVVAFFSPDLANRIKTGYSKVKTFFGSLFGKKKTLEGFVKTEPSRWRNVFTLPTKEKKFSTKENNVDTLSDEYREKVIQSAMDKIGCPYERWATWPNKFDCSGLWNWAFTQHGLRFPQRFNVYSFDKNDQGIPKEQVKRGDFMYWGIEDSVEHRHIEMVLWEPYQKKGVRYVQTLGSAGKAGGNKVAIRERKIESKHHFWRHNYFDLLADAKVKSLEQGNILTS